MLSLLGLAACVASFAFAGGAADLAWLKQGQSVGAYKAVAVYTDPSGAPKGARFLHERGGVVDVLFFDSVPQVSVYFRAPADDERGAPHTLEHLLLGKGASGRKLNTLMPVRMGQYTAGTDHDVTYYQFSSAAGPAEFYELLDSFLAALIRPEFTDEEIRREVAHDVALEQDGKLKLEEAGTVYDEMVARMEQPNEVVWDQMLRMVYGPSHPLSRNQGGEPQEIWKLSPADIRAFHAAHYHLDGRWEMVAALPRAWSAEDFLRRLDGVIRRLEPTAPPPAGGALPPFTPIKERAIRIGAFPSQDATTPQDIGMAWPPVENLTPDEKTRLDIALDLLGGDLPFVAGDYLEKPVKKAVPGAPSPGISFGAQALPSSYAWLQVTGLPPAALTASTLGALRDNILERIRWLHDLKPGAPSLSEIADKARTRMRSRRRSDDKWMQGPPRFGERGTDETWHRWLDALGLQPGFQKPLGDGAVLDRLAADLSAGKNPWAEPLERVGMLEPPYISAALPDPALLEKQKKRKQERIQAKLQDLEKRYGAPEQQTLQRFRAESDSATAAIDAMEHGEPRPSFLREPPLELDAVDWTERRLPSGPEAVLTRFDTPFTDIVVSFDLNGIAAQDREMLHLLPSALRGVGVVTAEGDRLNTEKANERINEEIWGSELEVNTDPVTDRAELTYRVHASSSPEIPSALAWLENYILRPDLSVQSRDNLRWTITSLLQSKRAIFQGDEETWVQDAAAAYRNQDRPMYMHNASPFTVMRDLNRLRWRMEEPSPAEFAVIRATAAAALAATGAPDRKSALERLGAVSGEFGEYVRWELAHMPDDSWRGDLKRIIDEYQSDLGRSQETIRRIQALAAGVLVRAGARVHVNGSARNCELAASGVDALLARLPKGRRARPPKRRPMVLARLKERLPGLAPPAHVALVNDGGKTGSIVVWAPSPTYRSLRRDDLLDVLALGVLAGGGGHSLFMKTWSAGLAYGNGLSETAAVGRASYYADKCPDPAQTLRFVADTASKFAVDDPFLLEYSLADEFGEYRAAQDFSSRGAALADDLASGNSPAIVRAFKAALLKTAREPGALAEVRARFLPVLRRILVGLPGARISAGPQAAAFIIGPEDLIGRYESFVRERGEGERVVRLYPRDFWP